MERKRVGTALMIVSCLGIIIAGVGRFATLGLDYGETVLTVFDATFLSFLVLFFIAIAVYGQDDQNQSEPQPDSSLS
ncbi:MAG: hypothetical protein RTU63_09900 [Candidatus Thorarchaeota archaeon]